MDPSPNREETKLNFSIIFREHFYPASFRFTVTYGTFRIRPN